MYLYVDINAQNALKEQVFFVIFYNKMCRLIYSNVFLEKNFFILLSRSNFSQN